MLWSHAESGANAEGAGTLSATSAWHTTRTTRIGKVLAMIIRGPSLFSFLHRVIPSATELDIAAILTHTLRQDPSAPTSQQAQLENTCQNTRSTFDFTMGDDDGSECCGGIVNCQGLTE